MANVTIMSDDALGRDARGPFGGSTLLSHSFGKPDTLNVRNVHAIGQTANATVLELLITWNSILDSLTNPPMPAIIVHDVETFC
jgi:hypothetical protein